MGINLIIYRRSSTDMARVKYKIDGKSESAAKLTVNAGEFKIIVDEPVDLGGSNDGPNPVQYVLAALCGCLNVVGHMIADEMGLTIRGLEFEAEGDLDPAKLFGKPGGKRAGYEEIRVDIKVDTDASEQELAQWLEKVDERCPVSDNLSNITPVVLSHTKC